jgi:hypothetical protein
MKRAWFVTAAALIVTTPTVAAAQNVGIGAHASTLGIGVEAAVSLNPRVAVRATGNVFPVNPKITVSGEEYEFDLPSPQFTGVVDLFLVGGLHVSGGVLISTEDLVAKSDFTGLGSADVGGVTYTGSDVGIMTATVINKDVSPYVGIGFGRVARKGLGFFLDLGVAFHGEPDVALAASGPLGSDPAFQTALANEAALFQDDIPSAAKYYPVVTIGFAWGF